MKTKYRILLGTMPLIAISSPAHAYIDPATGTLVVQGLIGGFVAFTTFAGLYYQKIRGAIRRVFTIGSDDEKGAAR